MSVCKWCGKEYTKTWNSQKYCSDTCKKYGYQEKTLQRVRKHRQKYDINYPTSKWGLGSGRLSGHSKKDFEKEELTIKNELKRLGIKI
ncbi:MAG: hypothetical protein Q4P18_07130 [Methanobrevibacter sp.]|uniref:hypothetical protein n=1 Tax=Methanobrevibacter sp. TaxID=66852 RepID=UPI0026DF2712|nr:hypothetical protein [Methanobrevibacter sp.]MDO5849290.1 hypothetical protein [Methanobrevibacter sp.]